MGIKSITLVGIALILLGIVAFAYQGISYTSREKVIDVGPLQASVDTKKTIPLSPLLGGLVLVGGIVGRGWNQEIVLVRLRVTYHGDVMRYYGGALFIDRAAFR
jgi:hypothetical protein